MKLTFAATLLLITFSAQGAEINVNFTGTNGRSVSGPAGAVASSANYTNLPGTSGSQANLQDSTGAPTTADIAWNAEASWFSNNPGSSQDAALLDGYLAIGQEEYGIDIFITEIPYAAYDVYVYFGNNVMGANGNLRINNGGTQYFYNTAGLLPTFAGYDQCTGRTPDQFEDGNYVVFENVQGSSLTVQQANYGGGQDSGIMGIQVVETTPGPRITLTDSFFSPTDTIDVAFALGESSASNQVVFVPRAGDPTTDVLGRLYVGGGASPSTAPASGMVSFPNAAGLDFGWYDAYFLSDDSGTIVLAGPETFQVGAPEPTVIPVGSGSYASIPPASEGPGAVFEALQRDFYVVDEVINYPIPTNDWWTDLLISQYAGNMWAYPVVLSADAQGANFFYPTAFDGGGNGMVLDNPVELQGEVTPELDPSDWIIEDFESGTYPAGWLTTGTAFGSTPAAGTLSGQGTVSGYLGDYTVNSFNGGDGPTGTLTSPAFTIDRDYLHFLVGGGNHPWSLGAPEVAAVNLVISGNVVETATGQDSEAMEWAYWDVTPYDGQTATIEIVDTATGGWGHILADHFFLSDNSDDPALRLGTDFSAPDARALSWGDWSVTMRLSRSDTKYMDITFGHGMPAAWVELTEVSPILRLSVGATFFDAAGAPVSLPITTDQLGILHGGRRYGLFLPDNTQVQFSGGDLRITLPAGESYYVIAALTQAADLATLEPYIYAIPRNTEFSWSFEPEQAGITTNWTVIADPLKGTNTEIVQGWIPHHYRNTTNNLVENGMEFLTPRGTLKCAVGSAFSLEYEFIGMAPHIPAPQTTGLANDYIQSRMEQELVDYAGVTNYGADTYFGGKDLLRFSRYMSMAHEMGHPTASTLQTTLRGALENWLTYTPGENAYFFAYMPKSGGLVGFNESFFTTQYTDHHFHYGYTIASSAELGRYDQNYLDEYGDMLTLVAKDYANWDRTDSRFPFLRTFDIWKGHSMAAGFSSPAGNNQESSSEAINSWAGMYFLGALLGDEEMMAAGAMGYTVEAEAVLEYWYDINGDVWSPNYTEDIVGILNDWGPAYATYFSADPAWIYGIQWIPPSPTIHGFLVRDPVFAAQTWQNLIDDRTAALGNADIAGMGASLGNLMLGYVLMFDPDFAAGELDRLWSINSPVVTEVFTGGISYYFTHAVRNLGEIQFDHHMSNGMGTVYLNSNTNTTTYVVFNPQPTTEQIGVYQSGSLIGCITVPPYTLASSETLSPCAPAGINMWYILGE